MQKLIRAAGLLLVIVVFGLGIFLGLRLGRWTGTNTSPRIYNTPILLQQVQTLSELVTVKYVMEKIEGIEVPSENILGKALGSENRLLLLAHGIVKAGVDLKRLKPDDLRIAGKQIVVRLPPPEILDAYLDDAQTKVIDRKTGLLAPPDRDLEQSVRQNAVDDIRRAARLGGILKDAGDRARAQLAGLFLQLGFEKVEFQPGNGPAPDLLNPTLGETAEKRTP
jgi:hypothetical protein